MRCTLICFLTLLLSSAVSAAETIAMDAQTAQALLAEIRDLRTGLQSSVANIQRVLIVMYRLQSEAWVLDRVRQGLENAQEACNQLQTQRKAFTDQFENFEAAMRSSENPAERKRLEDTLAGMKAALDSLSTQEQQEQGKRAEAESQFLAEQAKMAEFQEQLDRFDAALAKQVAIR